MAAWAIVCGNLPRIPDAPGGAQPVTTEFHPRTGVVRSRSFSILQPGFLELRRDIAALGPLHKIQLGEAHADFDGLFPKAIELPPTQTRHGARRHGRQFAEITGRCYYFNQSLFGMTKVYNVLPEYAVSRPTVASFQFSHTKDARIACLSGRQVWMSIFHNRNYAWR